MQQNEPPEQTESPAPSYAMASPRTPTLGRPMIIRMRSIIRQTSLSRSTIYRLINEGKFPKQIRLGGRSVGWDEKEVDGWLKNQMALRDITQDTL